MELNSLTKDPWTDEKLLKKYDVGTQHKGFVRNLTNFGLFLELEEGIDGLVHVSDLSNDSKIKHPSEFIKLGEKLEVIVMEQDNENRRLALSHKDLVSDKKKEVSDKKKEEVSDKKKEVSDKKKEVSDKKKEVSDKKKKFLIRKKKFLIRKRKFLIRKRKFLIRKKKLKSKSKVLWPSG